MVGNIFEISTVPIEYTLSFVQPLTLDNFWTWNTRNYWPVDMRYYEVCVELIK